MDTKDFSDVLDHLPAPHKSTGWLVVSADRYQTAAIDGQEVFYLEWGTGGDWDCVHLVAAPTAGQAAT